MLALVCVPLAACGSADPSALPAQQTDPSGAHTSASVEPFDCATVVDGATLLAEDPAPLDAIEAQLPLMRQMHSDTVLIWEQFGIRIDHLMVDGLPRMLIDSDGAGDRCDDIVAAIQHPHLVQVVEWAEDEQASLHELGSPPWRRLIESELGSPPDDAAQRWTEMGTGLHGITRIVLNGGEEAFAADLTRRYGPLVELQVGNFAYDPDSGTIVGDDLCIELPDNTAGPELSIDNVRRDGSRISFDVTNTGPATVHLLPNRIIHLTATGQNRTVTAFTGAETAEARASIAVSPGATETVHAHLTLAACNPAHGSALPAGTYEALLIVGIFEHETWEANPSNASPHETLVARLPIEIP